MKTNYFFYSLLLSLFFCGNISGQGSQVMLQGFNWESWKEVSWYNSVSNVASELGTMGIDGIWLPPASLSTGGAGYIPTSWYDLNSEYGTEQELRNLITNLNSNGIKAIADIVVNHRGGTTGWYDFAAPSWNTPNETWSICRNSCLNADCSQTGTGNFDYDPVSAGLKNANESGLFQGGRDLDHSNPAVRQGIIDWLLWLKNDIGFEGWRYDYVHGFDGAYIKQYNDATNPFFSVGELLEGNRNRIIRWLDYTKGGDRDANSSAFDFATKSTLQNAFNDNNLSYLNDGTGKASGVIGVWPAKAVTMLDNHDTGEAPNQAHWVFPRAHVTKGYAYILTHPGTPMVFWDHLFNFGIKQPITELIDIRKRNNLTATSNLNIVESRQDLYAAIIDDKVAMKIGSGSWSPGSGWKIATSGNDYAVWEKDNVTTTDNEFTVYFKKPSSWSGVNVHFWDRMPGSTSSAWPGNQTVLENGWYKFNFNNTNSSNLLFVDPNNTSNKSNDLSRDKDGWYENGIWYDEDPTPEPIEAGEFTVYFKKPNSWSGVNVHFWDRMPGSTSSAWPGNQTVLENGWYKFDFDDTNSSNLLFVDPNNTSNKSNDLSRDKDGWYDDGIWYDTEPSTPAPANGLTVHYNKPNNYSNAYIYYWGQEPSGCADDVVWPGVQMTHETGSWYEYTIGSCISSNLIFNSGNGQQTFNLYRDSEGWYSNGSWTNSINSFAINATFSNNLNNKAEFYAAENDLNLNYPFTTSNLLRYQIIDQTGRVLLNGDLGNTIPNSSQYSIDVSTLSFGLYYFKVNHAENNKVYKFFKR